MSDSDLRLAEDRARRFGGKAYGDFRRMVETEHPDFVLGLGRHFEMPAIFRYLVEAGVPFLMEKPWALTP